ncbi:DUF6160 family protein [Marinobacter alexandrii]|jgi:hypothetical protein|uniref:DUF6160 family protein n=1 Tax=Marinobacter alexandrii TaxID=2570351 RepID=UPI002ABD44E4|nr:DUF6160 family protein [Marinobacter alexandrii]
MVSLLRFGVLATAVSGSGGVLADLTPVADDELSGVVAQAGLTVEYAGHTTLGQFRFENAGAYQVDGITMGGAGVTQAGLSEGYGVNFDDARMTLDIDSDGVLDVVWQPGISDKVDWGFRADDVALESSGTKNTALFTNIEAWGFLKEIRRRVNPPAADGSSQGVSTYSEFTIENLTADTSANTVGIEGGYVKGTELAGFAVLDSTFRPLSAAQSGIGRDTVTVEVHNFAADIGMSNLSIGGVGLGAVTLDNVRVTDTAITLNH